MFSTTLIIGILLVACAPASTFYKYSLVTETDEFTGIEFALQKSNIAEEGLSYHTELNLEKAISPEGLILYVMRVVIYQTEWFFIESGESLLFLADGETITLSGKGSIGQREIVSSLKQISESASYIITPEQIEKLATAKETMVRLDGSKGRKEFKLKPKNTERFLDFYNRFVQSENNLSQ